MIYEHHFLARWRLGDFGAFLVLTAFLGLGSALADTRVALVIGNGHYEHVDKLANPVTDARNVRDALTKIGFEVVYGENLDKHSLERAIGRFAKTATDADIALAFFAGHGATFGDVPYVVPVDAQFSTLEDMPYELVPVETLIGELRRAKGVRIAILDACRDNSAERELKRSNSRGGEISRGLGRVKNPEGLIIAYATQYLSTAADGDPNGDSPFTAAFLNNIGTPGLDVKELFYKTAREVIAKTEGRQRPELSISFYDPYALVEPPSASSSGPGQQQEMVEGPQSPAPLQPRAADSTSSASAARPQETPQGQSGEFWSSLFPEPRPNDSPSVPQQEAMVGRSQPAQPTVITAPCGGAVMASLASRSAVALSAQEECKLKAKDEFKECKKCPAMVVVPAGSFTMGSPATEPGRSDDEGPQHDVTFTKPFAVGKFQVTVDEFSAFVSATGYDAGSTCITLKGEGSWRNLGFAQTGSHPAGCLNWKAAQAYAAWLKKITGKDYRLLSEAEFEYAARGQIRPGSYPRYYFGDDEKEMCGYGNGADWSVPLAPSSPPIWEKISGTGPLFPCIDGYAYTSPVGSFLPNAFGLYDMHGNVWQWTEDCYHDTYAGAPADGEAWTTGDCSRRVLRGGPWGANPRGLRAANRYSDYPENRLYDNGFRLARTLTP